MTQCCMQCGTPNSSLMGGGFCSSCYYANEVKLNTHDFVLNSMKEAFKREIQANTNVFDPISGAFSSGDQLSCKSFSSGASQPKRYCMQCGTETSTLMTGGLCGSCYFAMEASKAEVGTRGVSEALMKAYSGQFDQTKELHELWTRAAKGHNYKHAREKFWALVNHDNSPEADFVRNVLTVAGFELGTGSAAPRLKMQWESSSSTRKEAARTLSIDHAFPQNQFPNLATESFNLRFMLKDDNSRRGARWDANDEVHPENRNSNLSTKMLESQAEFRSKVEAVVGFLLRRKKLDQ